MPALEEIEKLKGEKKSKGSEAGRQATFQERFRERQERKVNLAKERNTRVVFARTRDTGNILNIVAAADKAVERLRSGMGYRYSVEEVANLLEEYKGIILQLSDITQKMCEKTDIPYRMPEWIKDIRGTKENSEGELEHGDGDGEEEEEGIKA